jgi:hypothetical protein
MTQTISTGACDGSSCVRLRDHANRGERAVGRDNRSIHSLSFAGSLRRFSFAAELHLFAGPFVELRWTDGGTRSCDQRHVRCAATGAVMAALAVVASPTFDVEGSGLG